MVSAVTDKNGWLPNRKWKTIQSSVPVTCVDVLLVKRDRTGSRQWGLIYRETPHQGRRWCLIGGRLLLNEAFRAAIIRQVRETLDIDVRRSLSSDVQPIFTAEYFSRHFRGAMFDPRQHAIGLVFVVEVRKDFKPRPKGEALKFEWFDEKQLQKPALFGFGQKRVLAECIRRLGFPP